MSCDSEKEGSVEHAIQTCSTVQSMIDFTAKHLYGLRTQCAPNEQITQKEIRDTESKLIKLFSKQLVIKAKLEDDQRLAEFPKIEKWLNIFGINEKAISVIVNKGILLTSLLTLTEEQVRALFDDTNAEEEAILELTTALRNLNAWTNKQIKGIDIDDNDVELHWTSYTASQSSVGGGSGGGSNVSSSGEGGGGGEASGSTASEGGGGEGSWSGGGGSPKYFQRPSTSSLPPDSFFPPQLPTPPQSTPSSPAPRIQKERHRCTPPPTPTLVRTKPIGTKYPSTPPPKKKIQLFPDATSLKKSRSCESQLASRVTNIDPVRQKKKPGNNKLGGSFEILNNRRPSTEGSEAGGNSQGPSPVLSPAIRSPPYKTDQAGYRANTLLSVPKSPIAPEQSIVVSSNHRFITKPVPGTCDYCRKHILLGKICKDCRIKYHRDCASRAPKICNPIVRDGSPNTSRRGVMKPVKPVPTLPHQDSGSNTSSCNSSTPSSPALPVTSPTSITSPSPAASPQIVLQPSQFQFPGEDPYPRFPLAAPAALFDNDFHSACQVCARAAPSAPRACNILQRHGSLQRHCHLYHRHALPAVSSPMASLKVSRPPNIYLKGAPLSGNNALSRHRHAYDRKLGLYTYPCLHLTSTQCVHRRSVSALCFPCFSASSEKPCNHDDYDDIDDDDINDNVYSYGQGIDSSAGQVFSDLVSPPLSASSQTPVLSQASTPFMPTRMFSSLPEPHECCPEPVGIEEQMTKPHRQHANTDVIDGVIDPYLTRSLDNQQQEIDINTNTSDDSDKTLVIGIGERTLLDRVDSIDSQDDPTGHNWSRQYSLSVQLKEWDIPFEEITIGEKIGMGRFGIVHKGHWHGDVAIKKLNMDPESDYQAQLSAFKLEVAMLKKTRHENLVLFMGACMKPPDLAIITSFCKGKSLYSSIYEFRQKFQFSKTVYIASQIAQGMGYLHARGIVHKDLKTKNIFWEETGKVVITDFGLFNLTKWCHGNRKGDCLAIPQGWLCYLSPEIMRSLRAGNTQASNTDLPFTEKSDVYAFGTVWYELLCGEWPFKQLPRESIIWQVGRGIKQSLCHIITSRDVKDILMDCWAFKPDDRPEFSQILKALMRLPRKPLIRSPSHPVHLSRSVDSVYVA